MLMLTTAVTAVFMAAIYLIPLAIQGGMFWGLAKLSKHEVTATACFAVVFAANIAQFLVVGNDLSFFAQSVAFAIWVFMVSVLCRRGVQWNLAIALMMSIVQPLSMAGSLVMVAPALEAFV